MSKKSGKDENNLKTSVDPDRPLTEEELHALFDQAIEEIENQTPEEKREQEIEMELLLASDPDLAHSMEALKQIFGEPNTVGNEKNEVIDWQEALREFKEKEKVLRDEIRQRIKAERKNPYYSDGRPKPHDHWFNMYHQYFLQRGGTIKYHGINGEHVEWSLNGWRVIGQSPD